MRRASTPLYHQGAAKVQRANNSAQRLNNRLLNTTDLMQAAAQAQRTARERNHEDHEEEMGW